MTTQLTQGQQRLKTVNRIAIGAFIFFILLGELYFSSFFRNGFSRASLDLMVSYLSFLVPGALVLAYYLRKVIKTIYVRETAELAEGFYTQRSWLDVDDRVLVAALDTDIAFFEIPELSLADVQKAYQQQASFDSLVDIAGISPAKVTRFAMGSVDKMSSSHKKDTIELEVDSDYHSVEFLNIKTKQHALKRFQLLLRDELVYRESKPTRLRACLPWLVTLMVFALVMAFIHNPIVWALCFGIGFFLILPKLLRELIDPTQLEVWEVAS